MFPSAIIVAGVAVGTTIALTGAGGSLIAVPILVHFAGLTMATASSFSLAAVAGSSGVAAISKMRKHLIAWHVAIFVCIAGIPAAILGRKLAHYLPELALEVGFVVLMVVAIFLVVRKKPIYPEDIHPADAMESAPKLIAVALFVGLVSGFLTGFFGVGGGFIIVPMLIIFLHQSPAIAAATSLVIIFINSVTSLGTNHFQGGTQLGLLVVFTLTAMVTSLLLSGVSVRLDEKTTQKIFIILTGCAVFLMLGRILVKTWA